MICSPPPNRRHAVSSAQCDHQRDRGQLGRGHVGDLGGRPRHRIRRHAAGKRWFDLRSVGACKHCELALCIYKHFRHLGSLFFFRGRALFSQNACKHLKLIGKTILLIIIGVAKFEKRPQVLLPGIFEIHQSKSKNAF